MARVAAGATTSTLAPHRRSVGIFSSAVFPAPTTRQRRLASFRNMGKRGIFSPESRDGGVLTSLPTTGAISSRLPRNAAEHQSKEVMARIRESVWQGGGLRPQIGKSRDSRHQVWIMAPIDFINFLANCGSG